MPGIENGEDQRMIMSNLVPHIGIVAATADGAALCHRILCHEAERLMGPHQHPEITMHQLPLKHYLACIDAGDWAGVAALMSRSARLLAQAGADLIICPNNTLHQAFDLVVSTLPWLHIAEAVADHAARSGYRRVGLLGNATVVEGTIYQPELEHHGIGVLLPPLHEQQLLDTIIRMELIRGQYSRASGREVMGMASSLAARGADGVILGCTELPLLLQDEEPVLPVLDSTRILAETAMRWLIRSPWQYNSVSPVTFTSH